MGFYGGGPSERPYDPIGGMAKRNVDQAVKNGKYVIQDAIYFFEWAKQDTSASVSILVLLFLPVLQ